MKKRWIALGLVALAAVGGYQTFEANKYRLPGIVQDCRDPVQPTRAVAWQQGHATPPAAKRPPNHILHGPDHSGPHPTNTTRAQVAGSGRNNANTHAPPTQP